MSLWQTITSVIEQQHPGFTLATTQGSSGGCINSGYRINGTDGSSWFVKINSADLLDMFRAEFDALQQLSKHSDMRIPQPLCFGSDSQQAFLVMELLEFGGRGSMRQFGENLAQMHQHTTAEFGWHRDNVIGSTHQPNQPQSNWIDFYRQQRLQHQLTLVQQRGFTSRDYDNGMELCQRLDQFFSDYTPSASLLHGDLWSGNYAFCRSGEVAIFDPATYFGDRETEIAMTELFGGFSEQFYAGYNSIWPLDSGYTVRKKLYNLYHILNHFTLFGGGYGTQAAAMIQQLLAQVR